ncbi:MAG: hypothetical protein AAB472_03130 [Patescibacteria group bacterium]
MTVTGVGGSTNCSTTVTVTTLPPPPPPPNAPTCTLTVNPQVLERGGSSTLSWTTSNATSVSINNGIGGVGTSGVRTVSPNNSTTYTLTAFGPGGTVYCSAPITVTNTPPPPPNAPTCTLSASPNSISTGGVSTLVWNTSNATSVSIDRGIGAVAQDGSRSVSPSVSTNYTLTATGAGGTVTCTTSVSVDTPSVGPTCRMSVSPSTIYDGDDAELTWGSENVRQVYISNGGGYTGQTGSRTVSPGRGTYRYEGTFYGYNGQIISCSATLEVRVRHGSTSNNPHVSLTQLPSPPDQPLSYVYLSDLPYTGLDLGPIGTAIYWLMLILWSLALAYLILFGALPVAFKKVTGQSTHVVENTSVHRPVAHTVAHTTPMVHAVSAPVTTRTTHSSYEGFKSFAGEERALSIEDIVKGLSREEELPVIPVAPAPVAVSIHQVPVVEHAPHVAKETPSDVPAFLTALMAGEKETVFKMVRSINQAGGDAEAFLSHVIVALDDAYRAKLDGTKVHPEIARICVDCSPSFLERLIESLSTAVDARYSAGVTGVKLALTRALHTIEG